MDIFEKLTGLNLSGDTYESEQRYRLIVAGLCIIGGALLFPYSSPLWVVAAIKAYHFYDAKKRHNSLPTNPKV